MRPPRSWYRVDRMIRQRFPNLRPAQQNGLSLWVMGTLLAGSGCQNAVATALLGTGRWNARRQYLREWLYEGSARAAPCSSTLDVKACFAPLLRWVLALWRTDRIALAIDATLCRDRVAALVISVLYRGTAIPVAWHIMPANRRGEWTGRVLELVDRLEPAVPEGVEVLVLSDRGLWSPRLWRRLRRAGWHPLMRIRPDAVFQPAGGMRLPARRLVPGPGHAWMGRGAAFWDRKLKGTLVVAWAEGQAEPWLVLTSHAAGDAGAAWYGMRMWIEVGFRALKSFGWRWEQTRRTDPERVARHWLVLSVATLYAVGCGTRVEDEGEGHGLPPPPRQGPGRRRTVSVFRLGVSLVLGRMAAGRQAWGRLWLGPEPWPEPPQGMSVTIHSPP